MENSSGGISGFLKGTWQLISSSSHSRTFSLLVLLVIMAAVPLTVFVSQQQQETRQRANKDITIKGQIYVGNINNPQDGIDVVLSKRDRTKPNDPFVPVATATSDASGTYTILANQVTIGYYKLAPVDDGKYQSVSPPVELDVPNPDVLQSIFNDVNFEVKANSATPDCNEKQITMSTNPQPPVPNQEFTFNVTGHPSVDKDFAHELYPTSGISCNIDSTQLSGKCTASLPTLGQGYQWTHIWTHCEGSPSQCTPACSKTVTIPIRSTGIIDFSNLSPSGNIPGVPTFTATITDTYVGSGGTHREPWLIVTRKSAPQATQTEYPSAYEKSGNTKAFSYTPTGNNASFYVSGSYEWKIRITANVDDEFESLDTVPFTIGDPPVDATPSGIPRLPEDINGDGNVDTGDYNAWLGVMTGTMQNGDYTENGQKKNDPKRCEAIESNGTICADVNQDGSTDILDFNLWFRAINGIK